MIKSYSELTCPHCNHKEVIKMPEDMCMYIYECKNCNKVIRPIKGDCCVFCSYGSVPCPSIQIKQNETLK